MKRTYPNQVATCLAATAALSASALGQSPVSSPTLLRTQTAFDVTVNLPYAEAAPLFGPEGERAWAGESWNPQFLYPQPAHDEQGAVFTIQHSRGAATWVNALFDLEARHFIYAYFLPGLLVTSIDVRFKSANPSSTRVHVVYTRTAVAPAGNDHVTLFTSNDKSAADEWQQAIDSYLASRKH